MKSSRGFRWSNDALSHPSRVRGLKFLFLFYAVGVVVVAPLAGAWIEIS